MFEWHKTEISEVALEFGTDVNVGRTNLDSKRKRGSNNNIFTLPNVDAGNIIRRIASDASLILLVVTYLIAAPLGFFVEAMVAIPLLLIVFSLACYIRYLSERRIFNSHTLLLPNAKIVENGKKLRLSVVDVEVGDLIYFTKGDMIPADARLVSSQNLDVAERFYNRKTESVDYKRFRKNHESLYIDSNSAEIYDNMVYAGSTVVSGQGRAIVTAIGSDTRLGRNEKGIPLFSQNDAPEFFNRFCKYSKRFSLAILLSLIPFSFIILYVNTLNNSNGEQSGLLYTFLIMLAVAVTSMSELISAPASAIITGTLFENKHNRHIDHGVTKLASVDAIADTDTILILCPDILIDKRQLVRRVFISDKEYRFDSLKSKELDSFSYSIALYITDRRNTVDLFERKALKQFLFQRNNKEKNRNITPLPTFFKVDDVETLRHIEYFRTDGGSQWKFDEESLQRLLDHYCRYLDLGLKVYLYLSIDPESKQQVFEGMVAVGEEYPFSDGKIFAECLENGIAPILILEQENEISVKVALNCGIARSTDDIVFASKLAQNGKLISDAPIDSRVYIGFGQKGTKEIFSNLTRDEKTILPVIKGLADKSAVLPRTVYATHNDASIESVKYTSSLALRSADAENCSGGIADALRSIRNSNFTRLKLKLFKSYLTFSTVFRISLIVMSMLTNSIVGPMPSLMILLSGLFTDATALLSIAMTKGSANTFKTPQKDTPISYFALIGFLVALASDILTKVLLNTGIITGLILQTFSFYSSVATQLFALAGFLIIIKSRTRKLKFNYAYSSVLVAFGIFLVSQYWLSDAFYAALASLSYSRLELKLLPLLFISGVISFALLVLIDRLFSLQKK